MKFHKMQGAGNDYVFVDLAEETVEDPNALAVVLSHRNFGIGGDGLILIAPSSDPNKAGVSQARLSGPIADARMRMFNADGSESEMCGNGIRCVAKYLYDRKRIGEKAVIETGAGLIGVEIVSSNESGAKRVRVNMGKPRLAPSDIPTTLRNPREGDPSKPLVSVPLEVAGRSFNVTCVSMGNPHCVIYVSDYDDVDPLVFGPIIELHEVFPARTNVEFVQVLSRNRLRQRTWERGSGETLACGTGASAVLVASVLNDVTERTAEIELAGGVLEIEWRADDTVLMTGPAEYVFEGRTELNKMKLKTQKAKLKTQKSND